MSAALRPLPSRESRPLVVALLVSLVLWNVPYGAYALYPFKLFATWLHEVSHGLVMAVTGAGLDRIQIFPDTSGLAYASRPVDAPARAAVACAGYMGTALWGALFVVLGRTRAGGRRVLAALGVVILLSAALAVRNRFGVAAVAAGGATLVAGAAIAGEGAALLAVNFLAAQSCINAVLDVRVLFAPTQVVDGKVAGASDAGAMAAAAGGPEWMWAGLWMAWSLACLYVALRLIRPPAPPTAAPPDESG